MCKRSILTLPRLWGGSLIFPAVSFLSWALLLSGCDSMSMPGWPKAAPERAASAAAWIKPGVDAATVESAYSVCLDVANNSTQKDFNIDQDIAASRGSDLQRSAFAGTQMRDARQTSRDRAQAILSSCMEGKGFTLAR